MAGQAQEQREIDPMYEAHRYEIFGRVTWTGRTERLEQYAAPLKTRFDNYALRVGDADSRRVAILFNDVTDRKQTEAALHCAKQEAEQAKTIVDCGADTGIVA